MIFSHVDLNPTIRALEIGSIISLRARDPNSSSTCVLLLVYFILRRLLEYKGFGASLFSTSSQSELTGAKVAVWYGHHLSDDFEAFFEFLPSRNRILVLGNLTYCSRQLPA